MRKIEVNQYVDRQLKPVTIDADLIDYLNPGLGESEIHFIDGSSIRIKETPEQLRKLIQKPL